MSAAVSMRSQLAESASSEPRRGADGKTYTAEQEARAMLLAAIDVGSKEARRLHDLAEDVAAYAVEIACLAGRIAAKAVALDEQCIEFACEYGRRVEAAEEPCRCSECTECPF